MRSWRDLSHSARALLVASGILVVGWSAALWVYLTSAPVVEDYDVYDWEHSKKYLRQVEVIGGKAAVCVSQLNDWLAGLWQGQSLAYTMAVLTAVVALLSYFAQRSRQPPPAD